LIWSSQCARRSSMPSVLPFVISLTLEWDALRNNLQFQKILADLKPLETACLTPLTRPSLFRFCSQRELTGQGIEDFRVPERPGIINRHSLEAPLIAIAHQIAIVAIHQ